MALVKVYNKNIHDYYEKYKGKDVHIKAGGFIEMDYEQAVDFLGTMAVIKKLKDGTFDKKTFKMLEITQEDRQRARDEMNKNFEAESEKVFVCQACSKEFRTKNGLLKHIKDKHQSQMEKEARDELLDNEDLD